MRPRPPKAVEAALVDLRRRGEPISIQAVARHAGVTRATIYRRPDLRDRITAHRSSPRTPTTTSPPKSGTGGDSGVVAALRIQVAKRDRKITELNDEIRRLQATIETLHGELDNHLY